MTKFNEQQLEAINAYKGAFAVVAGSGSGKSTILLNRIKNLVEVHNEPQRNILAVSFTNKTATELKQKLKDMELENVIVGTFHAICAKILLEEDISVHGKLVPLYKAENWFKSIYKNPNVDENWSKANSGNINSEDILSFIGYQKNHRKSPTDNFVYKESEYPEEMLREFYKAYEAMRKKEGLYDFDDHLLMCLDILEKNKEKYTYEFILVDEHQDTNFVQNRIIQELCPSNNIFCLFDYRQAIYGFRGGDTEYCMNFHKYWDNPKIINLFINYRSTNNIVENANKFIRPYFSDYEHYVDSKANNKNDGEIKLHTYYVRETEAIEVVDKIEKLIERGEKLNEIAVLYRLNSHSSFIENELKRRNIDYEITNDSSFFKRNEIKGIISYLRMLHNPLDDQAFDAVFKTRNYPLTFLSGQLFDKAKQLSGLNNTSLYEAFINMKCDKPWQQKNIREFESAITRLRLQVESEKVNVVTLIGNIVKAFKIESSIKDRYSNPEELEDRLNSITVLKSFVKNNDLEQFITYVYSNNTKKKAKKNSVKLMSCHASKGLEFAHVYLVGVELEKFPHSKSTINEESRLWYVGVTRSKENLHVSEIINANGERSQFIKEYFNNKLNYK